LFVFYSADTIAPYFEPRNLVERMLDYAASKEHIMDFTRFRLLTSMFALLNKGINNVISNLSPLGTDENMKSYIVNHLIFSLMWGFGSSMSLKERETFSRHIQASVTITTPDPNGPPLLGKQKKHRHNSFQR
jgi:dynein heavy chain 1